MFNIFRPEMAKVAITPDLIRPFEGVKEAIDRLRAFVEAQRPRDWPAASAVPSQPRIRLNQRTKHQRAECR